MLVANAAVFIHRARLCILGMMAIIGLPACVGAGGTEALERPAVFSVEASVVNARVGAFSATSPGFGNSNFSDGGAFEPSWFRTAFSIAADGDNVINALPVDLSHFDTYREPLLDGADVEVFRVVAGAVRAVRSDRVASAGAHFAGWNSLVPTGRLIPRGIQEYAFRWDGWNRAGASYYFNVRSVDDRGVESAASAVVEVRSPDPIPAAAAPPDQTQAFRNLLSPHGETVPLAPSNLTAAVDAKGVMHLNWKAPDADNILGFRVYLSDDPPEKHGTGVLELEGRATTPEQTLRKGDWVMLRKKLYAVQQQRDFSQRVAGAAWQSWGMFLPGLLDYPSDESNGVHWELVPHDINSPVVDGGETFFKLTLPAGQERFVGAYNYGGKTSGYDVLETRPYEYSVWIRQDGQGTARFLASGPFERNGQRVPPQTVSVNSNWSEQKGTFTPPLTLEGDQLGRMGLVLRGPGTFYLDNFRIRRADTPYLSMLPEDRKALRDSGMHMLRTHSLVRTGMRGYDLEQLTNPAGTISATGRRNTLPQILQELSLEGLDPWLQVELYLLPGDWPKLVEYLAAPYDPSTDSPKTKPWAFKRFSQGRAAPWTDAFQQINFELSNETWNSIFQPWVFPNMVDSETHRQVNNGTVYGLYQEQVIRALKSSPWWASQHLDTKFKFILGGFAFVPQWSLDAVRASPSSDLVTIAVYNGGWDRGQGPRADKLQSYFEVLNDVSIDAIPSADYLAAEIAKLNQKRAKPIGLGTYEGGPGYAMNGLNGETVTKEQDAAQERVMKSLAAGTATLDSFLARAYRGFTEQNYFTFSRGPKWTSHARLIDGGQPWPAWQLLSLFNHEGTGSMLKVDTQSVPTWLFPDEAHKTKSVERPLLGVYALQRDKRFMLFLTSRKLAHFPLPDSSGMTPVEIHLPFKSYSALSVFRTVGQATDNNLESEKVQIEKQALTRTAVKDGVLIVDGKTGADPAGLAPGATMLYVFEGVDSKPVF